MRQWEEQVEEEQERAETVKRVRGVARLREVVVEGGPSEDSVVQGMKG